MAVVPVSTVGDNTLGKYLKIVSQNSTFNQLADQSIMWKNILKKKKGPGEGRELRYLLRSAYGMASAQFVAVSGASVAYPDAHQATLAEATAHYKDFAVTIEVERALVARALSDMSRYGEPLAEELKCKTIALARMLSASVYQDGTGRIGTIDTLAISGGRVTITLKTGNDDPGHVGWGEYGDKIKVVTTAGVAQAVTPSSGSISYYAITGVNRANDSWEVAAYTSAGVELTISAVNEWSAGDYIIRQGITAQDYASMSTTADYGTASEAFVGLETLLQDDNRKVHGLNLTGAIKGTRKTVTGPIDSQHFQEGMSLVKVAVGEGSYSWKDAIMAPEVLDSLVESRETDRRFTSLQDNKRGVSSLGYVHGRSTLMFMTDEYCPKKRIYVIPEGDVVRFYGSDFEFVKPEGGSRFFLKPAAGGHYRSVRAYMEGSGLLTNVHPQACLTIEGFSY
jgi:hypothetical protein